MAKDDERDVIKSDPPSEVKPGAARIAEFQEESRRLVELAVQTLNANVLKGTLTS